MNFNSIPPKALPYIVAGISALAGGLVGVFLENQRMIKETKAFLDKRAADDRAEAAKNLGQTYMLMFIAKMMNDRAQGIDAISDEDKLAFQALYTIAWSKQSDEEKLDAYRNVLHNLENEMSDTYRNVLYNLENEMPEEEKAFFAKVMSDIASV